jgi:hypothetical protein
MEQEMCVGFMLYDTCQSNTLKPQCTTFLGLPNNKLYKEKSIMIFWLRGVLILPRATFLRVEYLIAATVNLHRLENVH